MGEPTIVAVKHGSYGMPQEEGEAINLRLETRLDALAKEGVQRRVFLEADPAALDSVLAGQPVTADQSPSLGCNIKWQDGNEPLYFNPQGVGG